MPTSEHGEYEENLKSPYNFEYYDSSWELEFMKKLEKDTEVKKWTKNHHIIINYYDEDGKFRGFKPDFLIEYNDGSKSIIEIKGRHLLPQFKKKFEAAEKWCKSRKIGFRLITKY